MKYLYMDPDGYFHLEIPTDWTITRSQSMSDIPNTRPQFMTAFRDQSGITIFISLTLGQPRRQMVPDSLKRLYKLIISQEYPPIWVVLPFIDVQIHWYLVPRGPPYRSSAYQEQQVAPDILQMRQALVHEILTTFVLKPPKSE